MTDKKASQDTAKKHVPAQYKGRNALITFISGRTPAVVAQLFMILCMGMFDLDKDTAVSVTVVTVVLVTALLTGFGVYDKTAQKCEAGSFTPISGFANCLASYVIEGRIEGPIFGIGNDMFRLAGSVLIYRIIATFILDTTRYLLLGV